MLVQTAFDAPRQVARRTRAGEERGQTIVVFLLFLTVLLGMAGLVVDAGYWFLLQRRAQAAADAGALAAAQALPGDPGAAHSRGEEYVAINLPAATATVVPGYQGNPRKVEVTAEVEGDTFFARVFGIETVQISQRAVAQRVAGGVPLAIFVYDTSCSAFGLGTDGDGILIQGGIHSNGSFRVNGNNVTVGSATAGGPNNCAPVVNGANITFGGEPMPAVHTSVQEWPAYFTESDFTCTYTAQKFEFNQTNQTIPEGVYCATESFKANGNNQSGKITVLAPEIVIDGESQSFTPFAEGVLFFATGTKELILNGNDFDWTGIIFHPGGRVKIDGDSSSVLNGLIEGLQVEVNGNGFTMNGTGSAGAESISLVE